MAGISVRRQTSLRHGPFVARAMAELRSWPALALSDTRRGVAFTVGRTKIVRVTRGDEVCLRLTAPAIHRLQPHLHDCDQVQSCSDRAWVAVHVDAEPDLDLLLALTSVAIKAHTP